MAPTAGYVNNLQKLEGTLYTRTHRFPSVMMECQLGDKRSSHYSANCAYRREVLTSSQGFDDSGLDAVDTELCWRLILMEKRCVFTPEIQVIHLGFPWSLSGVFRQQFRWGKSQALLNRRFQLRTGLKERILPYSSLTLSFLRIPCSKSRRYRILQILEGLAFHCGYLCSSFNIASGRSRSN